MANNKRKVDILDKNDGTQTDNIGFAKRNGIIFENSEEFIEAFQEFASTLSNQIANLRSVLEKEPFEFVDKFRDTSLKWRRKINEKFLLLQRGILKQTDVDPMCKSERHLETGMCKYRTALETLGG